MAEKVFTVAICGVGSRGAEAYGKRFVDFPEKYKIVALCDTDRAKLDKYGALFGVGEENRFVCEEEFFKAKRADLVTITTLDKDHVRQCLASFKLGYDILLEKPITDSKEECEQILEAQRRYGGKVVVCHVLRYAPGYKKVAELLDEGRVGRLVAIQAIEQVTYWHQAHSYVRGNWRKAEDTTPMILAKCCHDLDLIQYYAKSKCESVSSVGALTYFTAENAPEGTAQRCYDCKDVETCPYSAKRIYVDGFNYRKQMKQDENVWPYNVVTSVFPITEKALVEALKDGPYGQCVFRCDNNVVDHQFVQMTFQNGVKASLLMTAFTSGGGRIMKFFGTKGEIEFGEKEILVKPFGEPIERINTADLIWEDAGFGHGGGDYGLVTTLYDILCGNTNAATSLETSIESHLMGIAAEESRKADGKLIYIHKE